MWHLATCCAALSTGVIEGAQSPQHFVLAIVGSIGGAEESNQLPRLDGTLDLHAAGRELSGLSRHGERGGKTLFEPQSRQLRQIGRYRDLFLEAARKSLLAHGFFDCRLAERDPHAPTLGLGIGIGDDSPIRSQHKADQLLDRLFEPGESTGPYRINAP